MSLTKRERAEIRKSITRDWNSAYPSLGVYEPMWLMRRVGPVLIGIHLQADDLFRSYRPIFHTHDLTSGREFVALSLHQSARSERKNAEISINLKYHENHWVKTSALLARQAALPIEGDISLEQVLHVYLERLRHSPHGEVSIARDMLSLAAYFGRDDLIPGIARRARSVLRSLPGYVKERIGGVEAVIDAGLERARNRNEIISGVELALSQLKLQTLPYSEMLMTPYSTPVVDRVTSWLWDIRH